MGGVMHAGGSVRPHGVLVRAQLAQSHAMQWVVVPRFGLPAGHRAMPCAHRYARAYETAIRLPRVAERRGKPRPLSRGADDASPHGLFDLTSKVVSGQTKLHAEATFLALECDPDHRLCVLSMWRRGLWDTHLRVPVRDSSFR